ncbi:unnamed protein product, partial [Durusdinium trenchii]
PQLPLWRAELRVRNESDVTELGTPSSADTSTAASDNETGEVTHFKLIVKSTFLEFVQADDFRLMRCKSAPALHEGPSRVWATGTPGSLSDAVRGLFVACLGRLQALCLVLEVRRLSQR